VLVLSTFKVSEMHGEDASQSNANEESHSSDHPTTTSNAYLQSESDMNKNHVSSGRQKNNANEMGMPASASSEETMHLRVANGHLPTSTDGNLEISIVRSPTVFGSNSHLSPSTEDERIIERCDVQNGFGVNAPAVPSTSDEVPAAHLSALPVEMSRFFPPSVGGNLEEFERAMCQWRWHTLDGVTLPVLLRDSTRLAAVHVIQMKLLSKFPPNIPAEVAERHTMVSHKMNATEAWVLNTINATLCQFDLGCQIFTPNDELVDIESAELFYWVVKKIHMGNLAKFYEHEQKHIPSGNTCLQAAMQQLNRVIENDIETIQKEITKLSQSSGPHRSTLVHPPAFSVGNS
jgi:hypothetical protein